MKLILIYKKPIHDENNKIISFEIKNKYIINQKKTNKKGGDIFDNLDTYLLKKPEIKEEDDDIYDNKKEKIIKNIEINENLTLFNIKELIYNLFNIHIENQHIDYLSINGVKNFDYNYINNAFALSIDTTMSTLTSNTNIEYISEIPVDYGVYTNRDLYTIKEYSKIKELKYIINDIKDDLILEIYNLQHFIIDKKLLYNITRQDEEQLNMIYTGCIERYWPMYDKTAFINFLSGEVISDIYPNLYVSKNNIINKIELNSEINSLKEFKSLSTYIKNVSVFIDSFNENKTISIQDMFNKIVLKNFNYIKKIEAVVIIDDKDVYLEKIDNLDNNNLISFNMFDNIDGDALLISLYLNNKKYKIVNKLIYLIIDEYNNLYLNISLNDNIKLDQYKDIITEEINKIILDINKKLNTSITIINKYNIEIENITLFDLYDFSINSNQYNELIKNIKKYELLELYQIMTNDNIEGKTLLNILYKDFSNINDKDISEFVVNNYFNIYLDSRIYEKYMKVMYKSNISINTRINDIQVEYTNVTYDEYLKLRNIISKIINSSMKIKLKGNIIISKSNNKLKILKETDPILYMTDKNNKKNSIYSRKCQSSQQPIIVTKEDIKRKKIKNFIKFWNFTKARPEYYSCDNKKYPYVKFLTNIHPNKFCIPCCKKKSVDDTKIFSAYEEVHNTCLKKYDYIKENKDDVKSRYVMNYSCKIQLENNRLMELPITLKKLFSSLNEDENSINYYIKGINQIFNNNNVGILYILSNVLELKLYDTIKVIINLLTNNQHIFNKILNGLLLNYVSNIKELIILLNKTFTTNNMFFNSFNRWNEFFIDIAKYLGIIFIIINENDNDTVNDAELNIKLPNNINHSSEYIFNIQSYNYIILSHRNINEKEFYYPIFKLNYKDYFKNNNIYKKSFKYDNNIISRIKKIIDSDDQINKQSYSLNFNLLIDFINKTKDYNIEQYYLNKNNEIYAVLIKNKGNYIYSNIIKSKIKNKEYKNIEKDKLYTYNFINIDKYNITYKNTLKFINDINLFIYNTNKLLYDNTFQNEFLEILNSNIKFVKDNDIHFELLYHNYEGRDDILYDYLRIEQFIIYNKHIIGCICNGLNIYFSKKESIEFIIDDIDNAVNQMYKWIKNNNKSMIKNILIRPFKLEENKEVFNEISDDFLDYNTYFITYKYNPQVINKKINSLDTKKDKRITLRNEAIYNTNLYNLLIIHLTNLISKIKNTNIRTKIKFMISNLSNDDIYQIQVNNICTKLLDIINKENYDKSLIYTTYSNILGMMKNIIRTNKNKKINDIKKSILTSFDSIRFNFDNVYVYNILKLDKNELIKKLDSILSKNITNKNINEKYNIIDLGLCNGVKKSYYCENNKFIISKNKYKELLEILQYDLTNPFKQSLLLNYKKINVGLYKFDEYITEKIYVYY